MHPPVLWKSYKRFFLHQIRKEKVVPCKYVTLLSNETVMGIRTQLKRKLKWYFNFEGDVPTLGQVAVMLKFIEKNALVGHTPSSPGELTLVTIFYMHVRSINSKNNIDFILLCHRITVNSTRIYCQSFYVASIFECKNYGIRFDFMDSTLNSCTE